MTRFETFIKIQEDGHWIWTGYCDSKGYGQFGLNGKVYYAHRVSMHLYKGFDLNSDELVLHKPECNTPSCVNPDHLFLGTPADNSQDMVDKGRSLVGEVNPSSKLTNDQVLQIRSSLEPSRELGRKFGVTHRIILLVRKRKLWRGIN